jgi:hypothetical protein
MYLPISKPTIKSIFRCATAALLITGTASADSTPQTESFSIGSSLQSLSATGDFTLPNFDTSLGTLESVNLTLTVNNCSTINVFNASSSSESFSSATMNLLGSVTGPNNLLLNTSLESQAAPGVAQAGINTFNPGKNTTTTLGSVDSSLLGIWENQPSGVVDLSYTKGNPTFQGTDTGGDNLLFGGTLKGYGEVTVQYTYLADSDPNSPPLATPEPSAKYLSGLAAGAMALLLFGRRRLLNA